MICSEIERKVHQSASLIWGLKLTMSFSTKNAVRFLNADFIFVEWSPLVDSWLKPYKGSSLPLKGSDRAKPSIT